MTMKLSTKTRYGTRMLVYMAGQDRLRPVPLSEMSRKTGVSVKYLEQLLIKLRRAGLVKSVRGPKGGYLLQGDPADITVGDIVRVLENGIRLAPCIDNPSFCEKSDQCVARNVWFRATQALVDVFSSFSLARLVHGEKIENPVEHMPPFKWSMAEGGGAAHHPLYGTHRPRGLTSIGKRREPVV